MNSHAVKRAQRVKPMETGLQKLYRGAVGHQRVQFHPNRQYPHKAYRSQNALRVLQQKGTADSRAFW